MAKGHQLATQFDCRENDN